MRAAGIDADTFLSDYMPSRRDFESALYMGPWDDFDIPDAFSWRMEDGRIITWRGDPDLECIGCLGPEQVHRLAEEVIRGCDGGKPWCWKRQSHDEPPDLGEYVMRDWRKEIAQFREMVEQSMGCGSRGDSLLHFSEILAERGENVGLSSFDFDFAQKTGRADFILAYLDHLENHVALSPARFIDRHGDIVPPLRRSHLRRR